LRKEKEKKGSNEKGGILWGILKRKRALKREVFMGVRGKFHGVKSWAKRAEKGAG